MKTPNTNAQHRRRNTRRKFLIIILVGLVGSGCGSGDKQAGPLPDKMLPTGATLAPSWDAMLDQQFARDDLSEFEREVLQRSKQSGSIGVEDYQSAWNKYKQCMDMTDFKAEYTTLPNQIVRTELIVPDGAGDEFLDQYKLADDRCATGTVKVIESLFIQQVGNPGLLANPDEVAVTCLIDSKVAKDGYTTDDFYRDYGAGFENAEFDVMSPEAQACLAGAGIAVSVGEEPAVSDSSPD